MKFKSEKISEVIVKKLDIGDYACQFEDGHIVPIVFDRKAFGDLYGTMTSGYKRFKKKILEAQQTNTQLFIIVEGTMTEVSQGYEYSTMSGESMIKKLFTLWVKYNVQTIYCSSRQEMSKYIISFFDACGRQYIKGVK